MNVTERDDLAKLAYGLASGFSKADAKAFLSETFARERDLSDDQAWALYVRGKTLARMSGERV